MREIAATLKSWFDDGRAFGLATVVGVSGSAPRGIGAVLAVGPGGEALGGVSGGCVEGVVYESALSASTGGGADRLRFGVSGDDPFAIGLTCGGEIDVMVDRVDPVSHPYFGELLRRLISGTAVAEVSVLEDSDSSSTHLVVTADEQFGSIGPDALDDTAIATARDMLMTGVSGVRECAGVEVFIRTLPARPRMIVFGALDLSDAVAQAASFAGYHVVVCDARPIFATPQRFPHSDEVVVAWPHVYLTEQWEAGLIDESTALCVLTHDEKFDEPLLEVAVRTPAGYIGVMGSRATHDDRTHRMRRLGLDDTELSRLSSPIGLDIGGRSPQQTAVSIVAEVIAVSNGRSGGPLTRGSGAIHGDTFAGTIR